jgi:endonuclease/exonuclease/phosphatase family metal-dependent hydrolase
LARLLSISIAVLTVLAYLSPHISPESMWMTGFVALSIPVLLLINFGLLVFFLLRLRSFLLLPLCIIILGHDYIRSSFSFNPVKKDNTENQVLSVLNYNVRVFNTYAHLKNKNSPGKSMIEWLANNDSDIKCLQEFYNDDQSDVFNTVERLSAQNYHAVVRPAFVNRIGAQFGLAIFSRYPIIHSGDIMYADSQHQYAVYADIKTRQDTIRVYNVHLQSMSIDASKIDDFERAGEHYLDIARKLKFGFVERAKQVDNLLVHIQRSPYPVIVCGDFNDVPYSYTYQTLKRYLTNAFEEAGHGLGFSYNGKLFFLRIDNQFYSKGFKAIRFETHREVPFSDHFPVRTIYTRGEY